MIKSIIFDFGGVVLRHRKDIMEKIIAKMFSISFEQASEVWKENKAELVTGRMSSGDFLKKMKNRYKTKLTLNELLGMWSALYKKEAEDINWELLSFIEKLKTRYRVYLFTDTIDVHDQFNRTRGIYEKFHGVFKSFEERTIKTERNAFLNVLKKIKARAEECIFIDDLKSNVVIANKLGMKGIVFENFGQLKKELKKRININ
ncbi:MAG TPA: HAD-IA family hydrolase [Candidatus Bathyarchaeia archaeon]|nr:HAD-IA family hydrolase [Candidatus Bathyarchaeia archaeon]